MDQKELWNSKWSKLERIGEPTIYSKIFFDFVKDYNFKNILDLGCGDGKDSIYFFKNDLKVTSLDFSKESLRLLESYSLNNNLKIVCKDIREINFKKSSFDLIYANLSLHYFKDEELKQILNKLYKILKKEGMIFIRCKSTKDSLYGIGKQIEKNMFENKQTRHFFSEKYMRDCLKNFQILEIKETISNHSLLSGGERESGFIQVIAKKI